MTSVLTFDSSDEEYDITLEEEALLSSLVTDLPSTPLSDQGLAVVTPPIGGAKSALHDDHGSSRFRTANGLANKAITSIVQVEGAAFATKNLVQPTIVSAVLPHGDQVVRYPDRKNQLAAAPLPNSETGSLVKN